MFLKMSSQINLSTTSETNMIHNIITYVLQYEIDDILNV